VHAPIGGSARHSCGFNFGFVSLRFAHNRLDFGLPHSKTDLLDYGQVVIPSITISDAFLVSGKEIDLGS